MQLSNLKNNFKLLGSVLFNIFFSHNCEIFYVVENAEWSIFWDGKYLVENLSKTGNRKAKLTFSPIGLRKKIIHFGSVNTLISKQGLKNIHPSNKIVLTWFHISPNDVRTKFIPELNSKVDLVHTSCNLTKEKLKGYGLTEEKIIVIPLGVDLDLLKPQGSEKIAQTKKDMAISESKIIIGSFQKDGEGWGDGFKPKLIKGPDIFCDVVEKLSQKFPIHVLLTGPARGYVKKRLDRAKITYTHRFLKDYPNIVDFYNILDLYLITSRAEGGPKAILESMACKVPLVTTPVGMAPEVLSGDLNFLIAKNRDEIFKKAEKILQDSNIKENMVKDGLEIVKKYDWKIIAKTYIDKIYQKL